EGERFNELATADLALLEFIELVCDETFHDHTPSRSAPERILGFRRRDLHVVAEWIEDMQAAFTAANFKTFGLEGAAHSLFVPVGYGVADVIDHGPRGLGIGCCRARHDERTSLAWLRAEHQIRPLAVVLAGRALHAEHRRVEVARLGI